MDQKDNSSIAEQKASVSFLKHEAKPNFKHLLNLFGSLSLSVSCYIKEAMGSMFSSPVTKEQMENALTKAKNIVSSNPVVVFSKTYCGYCTRVKQLLSQLGATFKVIELDQESDGNEVQQALLEWTGQRTVPNVFIGGEHVGFSISKIPTTLSPPNSLSTCHRRRPPPSPPPYPPSHNELTESIN